MAPLPPPLLPPASSTPPLELRNQIYTLALADAPDFDLANSAPPSRLTLYRNYLPGITFANRRTHAECLLVYLRLKRIIFNGEYRFFVIFVESLPIDAGLAAVRRVKYQNVVKHAPNHASSLAVAPLFPSWLSAQLPGLQQLTVEIYAMRLCIMRQGWGGDYVVRAGEEADQAWHLARASEHPLLRYLKVRIMD